MRLRFWRERSESPAIESPALPPAASEAITHRQFLKLLLGAVGGAGLAGVAVRSVEATYTPGSPSDTVDTNLTVQGNLIVTSGPNGAGNVGIGTTNPQSKLDVAGEVRNGAIVLLDSLGRARQCYFSDGTALIPPIGSWGVVSHYTWGEVLSNNWRWDDLKTLQQ